MHMGQMLGKKHGGNTVGKFESSENDGFSIGPLIPTKCNETAQCLFLLIAWKNIEEKCSAPWLVHTAVRLRLI